MVQFSEVLAEGFELLRWSVLAASTIGPGTVIVCSKAGADYALRLCWSLVLASFVAYSLQEGAARLSLVGRTTLGQAMRTMWGGGGGRGTPRGCAAVALGVLVGNTAYQANNFVGAAEAAYALGAPRDDPAVRAALHLSCGLCVLGVLLCGDVDRVSAGLGVASVLMIVTFAVAVSQLGVDGGDLFLGLLPSRPPRGSGVVTVSLVATTAIPFNAFLASCAAKPVEAGGSLGAAVSGMRRGVTLATAIALVLSVLIVATGAGVARHEARADDGDVGDGPFSVERLVDTLRRAEGDTAVMCFGLGLWAAAFSSALTVALGAAQCCASLLAESDDDADWAVPDGRRARAVVLLVVAIAVVVGASGASTVDVVLAAQVVNGLLLPVVALCLVLCYNDPKVLRAPPPLVRNAAQVACFSATAFLATNGVLGKALDDDASLDAAFAVAAAATLYVFLLLWRQRRRPDDRQTTGDFEMANRETPKAATNNPLRVRTDSDDSDEQPVPREPPPPDAAAEPITPAQASQISSVFLESSDDELAL